MLILDAGDAERALPMGGAIAAMVEAFSLFSSGKVATPLRTRLELPGGGMPLSMPSLLEVPANPVAAVKAVSVCPGNRSMQLPGVQASILLLDGITGSLLVLMEGPALTAIRTGASSGLATRLLYRPESTTAGILGAGSPGPDAACRDMRGPPYQGSDGLRTAEWRGGGLYQGHGNAPAGRNISGTRSIPGVRH